MPPLAVERVDNLALNREFHAFLGINTIEREQPRILVAAEAWKISLCNGRATIRGGINGICPTHTCHACLQPIFGHATERVLRIHWPWPNHHNAQHHHRHNHNLLCLHHYESDLMVFLCSLWFTLALWREWKCEACYIERV